MKNIIKKYFLPFTTALMLISAGPDLYNDFTCDIKLENHNIPYDGLEGSLKILLGALAFLAANNRMNPTTVNSNSQKIEIAIPIQDFNNSENKEYMLWLLNINEKQFIELINAYLPNICHQVIKIESIWFCDEGEKYKVTIFYTIKTNQSENSILEFINDKLKEIIKELILEKLKMASDLSSRNGYLKQEGLIEAISIQLKDIETKTKFHQVFK